MLKLSAHILNRDNVLAVRIIHRQRAEGAENDFFSILQEPDSVVIEGSELTVRTPRGMISVLSPTEACRRYSTLDLTNFPETPYFLGFAVRTDDLALVVDYLIKMQRINSWQKCTLFPTAKRDMPG